VETFFPRFPCVSILTASLGRESLLCRRLRPAYPWRHTRKLLGPWLVPSGWELHSKGADVGFDQDMIGSSYAVDSHMIC
jgi:hypothetical protein